MEARIKGETDWIDEGRRAVHIKEIFMLHDCVPTVGETITSYCNDEAIERKLIRIR